jgi:hypothetical protein
MAMVLTGVHLKRTTILRANLEGLRSKGGAQALKRPDEHGERVQLEGRCLFVHDKIR